MAQKLLIKKKRKDKKEKRVKVTEVELIVSAKGKK